MSKRILLLSSFICLLFLSSCSDDDDKKVVDFGTAPAASLIESGTVEVVTEDDVRYHVLVFGELVTSTIIESETDVILVDVAFSFQNIANSGKELRSYVDAINKTISVIITHDHRDHFGNINEFADATIYAEKDNAAALLADPLFTDLYNGPVTALSGTENIGGLEFTFDNISNAEGAENGFLYLGDQKALFAGDLVFNKAHAYIREYTPLDDQDELEIWIEGLENMKDDKGDFNHIFMGHNGRRADVGETIEENIAYLRDAHGLIKGTKELTAGGFASSVQEVVDELLLLYPTFKPGGLYLALPDGFFPGDPGAVWF